MEAQQLNLGLDSEPPVEPETEAPDTEPEAEEARPEPTEAEKLKARIDAEREARIRAEEQLRAQQAQQARQSTPKPEPRRYSRTQLSQAVEQGKLTQAQADQLWERQQSTSLETRIHETVEAKLAQREQQTKVADTLHRYLDRYPDLRNRGSQDFQKASREMARLVRDYGMDPNDPRTEVLALDKAFGPPERIKERTRRETPRETHSSASPADRPSSNLVHGVPLTVDQRRYFEYMMANGHYPGGWNDEELKKELQYVKASR